MKEKQNNPQRRPQLVRTVQAILGGRPIALDGPRHEPVEVGRLRSLFHTVHLLLVGIRRSHLTRLAAALSYRTMFGLIPVVVIVAVALAAFTSEQTQREAVSNMLRYAGLDRLTIDLSNLQIKEPGAEHAAQDPGQEKSKAQPPAADARAALVQEARSVLEGAKHEIDGATAKAATSESIKKSIQPLLDDLRSRTADLEAKIAESASVPPESWGAHEAVLRRSIEEISRQAGDLAVLQQASTAQRLDTVINNIASQAVGRIRQMPFNLIWLVAIATLVYAAIAMLVEIEQAFNNIYNAPEGRGWIRRIVQYWALLTLGPFLLIASFSIQSYFTSAAETATTAAYIDSFLDRAIVSQALGFISGTAVSTLMLMVIYTAVPNTRVQPMPALLGAFVAAVLWEIGKRGFTTYVGFATDTSGSKTNYANLYGAIAILPLFLLWIYLSWLIVLFGLQLAFSMQTYRQATARGLTLSVLSTLGLIEDTHPAGRPRLIDPAAMLVVLTQVAERFANGQTCDHNQLSQATGIDELAVGEMLEKLAGAGVLHRVAGTDRFTKYTLARPPESIRADEVLHLADDMAGPLSGLSKPSLLTNLVAKARYEAVAGKTLADCLTAASPASTPSEPVSGTPAAAAG